MQEQTQYTLDKSRYAEKRSLSTSARLLLTAYETSILPPHAVDIGPAVQVTPLYESETPPLALQEYQVHYPPSLVEAYKIACNRYDQHFMHIVQKHRTWTTDYQYAPNTLAFQVDGPAYPNNFLHLAADISPEVLAEFVMRRVFEFEANIAAYGLNNRLWPDGTTRQTWAAALEILRMKTGKKVAVLAGTEQKLDEMLMYEMGVTRDQLPAEETIRTLTGFYAFLGPNDIERMYEQSGGNDCPYVLYGRISRPKAWLRNPAIAIDEGFLANPEILRYVRAHALTHNIDNPTLSLNHPAIIMDTKEALVTSGAAYLVTHPSDIYSPEFLQYLATNGIDIDDISTGNLTPTKKNTMGKLFLNFPYVDLLSESLMTHLQTRGAYPDVIAGGDQLMRAKPLKQHYGIYGHEIGALNRAKFLNTVMEQIRIRGYYLMQPEFNNLHIVDCRNPSDTYIAIDRVFFVRGANGELKPMESCRSLMPVVSPDGQKNSVHEGAYTRCARVVL